MSLDKLAVKLLELADQKQLVQSYHYPDSFTLHTELWSKLRALRKYTDDGSVEMARKFQNHLGSLGYEYAATVAYLAGKLYVSELLPGNWTSVETKMSINIKHQLVDNQIWQERYLNNQLVDKLVVQPEETKQISLGFIANFHSHPRHRHPDFPDKFYYTFFSATDFNSLLNSNINLLGLITDQCWVVAKTANSKLPDPLTLNLLTQQEITDVNKLPTLAAEQLTKFGWVVYYAQHFGEELRRIN